MISVCIATHNGEKYIKDQLDSILHQLGDNDEVVISDDGSTDSTIDIIQSYGDKRIRIVNFRYTGPRIPVVELATINFENALKEAKGDYIILSDQDDVWTDDKVKVCMSYLKTFPLIVSDCYVTDMDLNVIYNTKFRKEEHYTTNKYLALILNPPYQGSCMAFRREVLDKSLPFPKGLQSHDRWLGDVAAFFFSVKIIPEKLIYYRRHNGTASNTFRSKGMAAGLFKTIRYKWIYVKSIIALKLKD